MRAHAYERRQYGCSAYLGTQGAGGEHWSPLAPLSGESELRECAHRSARFDADRVSIGICAPPYVPIPKWSEDGATNVPMRCNEVLSSALRLAPLSCQEPLPLSCGTSEGSPVTALCG